MQAPGQYPHVPGQELPRVLRELHMTLKLGGVLFSSNPRGCNEEGWHSGRYGVYHDLESWRRYESAAGFVELTHYCRPDGDTLKWPMAIRLRWASPSASLSVIMLGPPRRFLRPPVWTRA
jgi:hypothetical protein